MKKQLLIVMSFFVIPSTMQAADNFSDSISLSKLGTGISKVAKRAASDVGIVKTGLAAGVFSLGSLPFITALGRTCIDLPISIIEGTKSAAQIFKKNLQDRSTISQIARFPLEAARFALNATTKSVKTYAIRSSHLVTNLPLYFSSYWSHQMLQDELAGRPLSGKKALLVGAGLLATSITTGSYKNVKHEKNEVHENTKK